MAGETVSLSALTEVARLILGELSGWGRTPQEAVAEIRAIADGCVPVLIVADEVERLGFASRPALRLVK